MKQSLTKQYLTSIFIVLLLCSSSVSFAQSGKYKKHKKINNYRAPIHHYYAVGHRVSRLPTGFISLSFSGRNYFYHSGVYYRPFNSQYVVVNAPIGASIRALPYGYRTIRHRNRTYYAVNGAYYIYDDRFRHYKVVERPDPSASAEPFSASSTELFVYPREGQTAERTARDRYECYLWSVNETGFDPVNSQGNGQLDSADDYRRATSACLEARGYTVK